MEAVAAGRTEHVRLIIQDIHDPHNIAACMRSAEGLGILNIDVINLYQAFKPSTAAKGAGSWLKIRQWSQVSECVSALREEGYLIAAGMPSQDSISLYDMPVQNKIALLFGNEHQGVAKEWLDHVDIRFTIPMVGMVESFNISVSAALSLADVSRRARLELGDTNYYLSEKEQHSLLGEWPAAQLPAQVSDGLSASAFLLAVELPAKVSDGLSSSVFLLLSFRPISMPFFSTQAS